MKSVYELIYQLQEIRCHQFSYKNGISAHIPISMVRFRVYFLLPIVYEHIYQNFRKKITFKYLSYGISDTNY